MEEWRREEEERNSREQEGITESIVMEVRDAIKKKGGKSEFSFQQPVKSEKELEKDHQIENSSNMNESKIVKFSVEEPQKDKIKKTQLMNELTRKSVMRNQTFVFDSGKIVEEVERKRFQTCPDNDRFKPPDMETETKLELEGIYLRAMKKVEGQ